MPGSLPATTRPKNVSQQEMDAYIEWGNKILQAGWWLDYANRSKEYHWQKELMNKIINVNIITGKPRTPLI